ncbi:hypothetical protein PR048_015943 [Dryococelus australis]|uniref:Uncharacterized protein n=1 Tax=Dryococelus australis TaxID=614101 RepID=A0ABQ9HIC0_9NEOP|nr:hypothetical protein PR048_015943 [Dryococelus australis]
MPLLDEIQSTPNVSVCMEEADNPSTASLENNEPNRAQSENVNTALNAMKRHEGVRDLRGISGCHNGTDENRVQGVIEHTMKFPKYKLHYRKNDTEQELLNPDTTLSKMYDLYKSEGHCYVWVEGEAGRGVQEVGSCLKKRISEQIGPVKELILWSDSCSSQHRNIKIALIFKTVLKQYPILEKLTMKFLMFGHSLLHNDNDFGDIESALKLQQRLYTPDDYIAVTAACRKKNPLIVHRMNHCDFIGTSELEASITNSKKYVKGQKVSWLETRDIEVRKATPYSISYENFIRSFNELGVPLWPNGKPVSVPKLSDLKSMMNLIPDDAKPTYQSLFASPQVDDDIEGFDGVLDFQA